MDLPGTSVPDEIHLLPATHGEIRTFDGRGPYLVGDVAGIIAASMADPRGLPIDENHAIDLAAPQGGAAPARGWVTALEARDDGIWGRVEWTNAGHELVADKAYRGISPVLALDPADRKTIRAILRASLVNQPNLRGLAALHQESMMDLTKLAEALGLPASATADEILAAIQKLKGAGVAVELEQAMSEIGIALGVSGATPAALAAATTGLRGTITELQSQLTTAQTELTEIKAKGQRAAAETVVDAAIAAARAGVKPQRERFIAMHMADPAGTEALIAGLPALGAGATPPAATPPGSAAVTALNAQQTAVARLLGISDAAYLTTLKAQEARQ